ncbi:MAG: Lar family restriction alleviation protein [Cytophagales bacterium]|nr:Lar family restriction alleviation protein [Cytophagales bacterium]
MTDKLKTCDWCGSKAVMRSYESHLNANCIMYSAMCSEGCCECPSGWHKSKKTAIKHWNTRASDAKESSVTQTPITWEQLEKNTGIAEFMGTPLTELSEHKQEVFWDYIRGRLCDDNNYYKAVRQNGRVVIW